MARDVNEGILARERLNDSALKAKRNLWFFAVIAFALATEAIEPSQGNRVVLAGIGYTTSLYWVLLGLGLVLAFNLVSLRLHGPHGHPEEERARDRLISPEHGIRLTAVDLHELLEPLRRHSPGKVLTPSSWEKFNDWLGEDLPKPVGWNGANLFQRHEMMNKLWWLFPWYSKWQFYRRAWKYRDARLIVFGYPWDVQIPLSIGLFGIAAVCITLLRMICETQCSIWFAQ